MLARTGPCGPWPPAAAGNPAGRLAGSCRALGRLPRRRPRCAVRTGRESHWRTLGPHGSLGRAGCSGRTGPSGGGLLSGIGIGPCGRRTCASPSDAGRSAAVAADVLPPAATRRPGTGSAARRHPGDGRLPCRTGRARPRGRSGCRRSGRAGHPVPGCGLGRPSPLPRRDIVGSAMRSGPDPPGADRRLRRRPRGPGPEPFARRPSPHGGTRARSVKLTYGSLLVTSTLGYSPTSVLTSSVLSPSSALRAMAISVVPSPRFINRTPLVCRPALRTWRAAVRMTPPPEVMAYNSVSSSTINAPTRLPRLLVVLDRQHPFAAAALDRVLLDRGALGVPAGRRDQQIRVLAHDVQRQQFVVGVEPHALHTGGGAAHRAQRLVGC